VVTGVTAPPLPGLDPVEETAADLWATGLSAGRHPTEFVRDRLTARGAVTAEVLRTLPDRTVVEVGGVVTHRQQPATAKGVVFCNLEDETGLVNVVCTPDVWARFRRVARESPALVVRGLLERRHDVVNVIARRIEPLALPAAGGPGARDFR
jgi:error-prone DNA polymerase